MGGRDLRLARWQSLKIVTHNVREFVRGGGLGLDDWRSR